MFTEQVDNNVVGSMAGRDVNNLGTTHITNNQITNSKKTQIEYLYDRLKQEVNGKVELQEFVEELQHFMGRATLGIERSLSDKLSLTGRSDLISIAEEAKEKAVKKIMRYQSSPAAQDIFAHVLGELHTKYLLNVRPLIAAGKDRATVDAAMDRLVISPIAESMEPSSLALTPSLILALLFYLAGNCHVQWD
jgi:hypothetical protein